MAVVMNNFNNNNFANHDNWQNMVNNFQVNHPNQPDWFYVIFNDFVNHLHLQNYHVGQIYPDNLNNLFRNWMNNFNDPQHFVELDLLHNFANDDIPNRMNNYNMVMRIFNELNNDNRDTLFNLVNQLINFQENLNDDHILNNNNLINNHLQNNINLFDFIQVVMNLDNNDFHNINNDDHNQIMNEPIMDIAGNIIPDNVINNAINFENIFDDVQEEEAIPLPNQHAEIPLPIQHAEREDMCSVCITNIEVGEDCIITHCDHMFHPGCINPWLARHHNCPNCRAHL